MDDRGTSDDNADANQGHRVHLRLWRTVDNASGLPIAFASAQPLINSSYIAIVTGSRKCDAAMHLLDYFMRPDLRAAYCSALPGNGPIARDTAPLLDGKAKIMLPDFDNPQTAVTDVVFWADEYAPIAARFNEWLLTS